MRIKQKNKILITISVLFVTMILSGIVFAIYLPQLITWHGVINSIGSGGKVATSITRPILLNFDIKLLPIPNIRIADPQLCLKVTNLHTKAAFIPTKTTRSVQSLLSSINSKRIIEEYDGGAINTIYGDDLGGYACGDGSALNYCTCTYVSANNYTCNRSCETPCGTTIIKRVSTTTNYCQNIGIAPDITCDPNINPKCLAQIQ